MSASPLSTSAESTTALLVPGEPRLADWTQTMNRSLLRQMITVVSQPGILSFAGGLPAPELFPTEAYAAALAKVLANDPGALQYAPPFAPLKRHIVGLMRDRGVACTEDQIFLTTGAQQGLDILSRMLLNQGDPVILEEFVYTGAQQAIAPFQPQILPVPTDLETGMDVDAVARILTAGVRPAFIYIIPEAHNPLGVSLSRAKRAQLVALAREYAVPIVEDDPYGLLCYDRPAPPPLRALDDQWVFYLGSFSKILAPALRLGWLVAPASLITKLTVVKEAGDLESSGLTQRAVAAFLDAGLLPAHIERLCTAYGERRNVMLQALQQHFPPGVQWTSPAGGMFIWLALPEEVDTAALLQDAIAEEQVAFIPGYAFAVDQRTGSNCLRLNFSNCSPEQIEDGMARLARVVARTMTRHG